MGNQKTVSSIEYRVKKRKEIQKKGIGDFFYYEK